MRKLLNTLFVTSEDAYLALENENVVVYKGDETAGRYPLQLLEGILCFSYKGASPALMGACAHNHIQLTFLTPNGKFLARAAGESQGNVLLRREQYRVADNPARSCLVARNMIFGKVYNSRWVIERTLRDHAMRVDAAALGAASARLQAGLEPILHAEELDALRGLEGFSHLWLIFQFHQAVREGWSPTVRPPRLGGNRRMGVFATRSPFRPNAIGLSCVKLEGVRQEEKLGPVLDVSGADLVDGTPILDIKPYLPYADCRPEATGGFTDPLEGQTLQVVCEEALLAGMNVEQRAGLMGVLACDPRPRYQEDPERVYGLAFAGKNVRFTVQNGVLTVLAVED